MCSIATGKHPHNLEILKYNDAMYSSVLSLSLSILLVHEIKGF